MRLIITEGSDKSGWLPELCTWRDREPYAILSHRWHEDPEDEILFADIEIINQSVRGPIKNSQYAGVNPRSKPTFSKLRGAAQRALMDGFAYIWVDTCCIDKNSSAELTEAINSMFKWYSMSSICYVYLADCHANDVKGPPGEKQFRESQWWTRGWTLQELLAPSRLIFFNSAWSALGRKHDSGLYETISAVTGIDVNVVNGTIPLNHVSVAQRMSWAAKRFTSRVEDIAYCLMGIFSVNMPLLYGEGERAFLRLQEEIMKTSDDETLFAWNDPGLALSDDADSKVPKGLLATHPAAFVNSRCYSQLSAAESRVPFAMTNNGLSISLPLEKVDDYLYIAWLRCVDSETSGRMGLRLKKLSSSDSQYARVGSFAWGPVNVTRELATAPLYVKQVQDPISAYSKLSHYTNMIQLIQVLPTEDTSSLTLRLLSADVETAKYTALSHIWDDRDQRRKISINSDQVEISEKVIRFLQQAQRCSPDVLYWLDMVCIQQADFQEKLQQVNLMSKIFQNAFQVVVILADISLCKVTDIKKPTTGFGRGDGDDDDRLSMLKEPWLRSIAADRYWTRVWVLQEFILARDILFYSATDGMQTSTLPALFASASKFRSLAERSINDGVVDLTRLIPFLQFARSTQRFRIGAGATTAEQPFSWQPSQVSFEDLIVSVPLLKCFLPQDRVYSLLNICDLGPKFQIDYGEPVEDLLVRVVAARGGRLTTEALSCLQEALGTNLSDEELAWRAMERTRS